MKNVKKIFSLIFIAVSVIFLNSTNSYAATAGDQLTSPEPGWYRIDDAESFIVHAGSNWKSWASPLHYQGAALGSTSKDAVIKFKFKGTKLRIIGSKDAASKNRGSIDINIDGVKESYTNASDKSTWETQIIVYEKTGLSDNEHIVYVTNPNGVDFGIDAVDVDGSIIEFNQPINLKAVGGNKTIDLKWDSVETASYYIIKRSNTPGGPYTPIETKPTTNSYSDTDVTHGITYYYVVSSVVSGTESQDSNEASSTLTEEPGLNILKVVLEVKEQLQLSVDDDLEENTKISWTSSDISVATVDGNGAVVALKPGNTVITCVSEDGEYTDNINVLVVENAKDYRLAVDLKVGKSCRLTVDDYTNTVAVTWTSIDPTVATVSSKGKVTAVSKGLTIITATDDNGNEIGQIYVRVRI